MGPPSRHPHELAGNLSEPTDSAGKYVTMSQGNPMRILIVDDHPLLRQGLAALIAQQADMVVVGEARNGREATERYALLRPDVTLMDIRMPEVDGVEAAFAIRRQFPNARILILTAFDDEEDIYQALKAGARAYLLKDTEPKELLQTIRAVHAGEKRIPPAIAVKLSERLNCPTLTEREMGVLRQMVAGRSNQEIAGTLFIAEGTVKFHINNILGKLEVSDRTQAVTEAIKRGIVRLS